MTVAPRLRRLPGFTAPNPVPVILKVSPCCAGELKVICALEELRKAPSDSPFTFWPFMPGAVGATIAVNSPDCTVCPPAALVT